MKVMKWMTVVVAIAVMAAMSNVALGRDRARSGKDGNIGDTGKRDRSKSGKDGNVRDTGKRGRGKGGKGRGRRSDRGHRGPVTALLDTDKDGVLSAAEIDNAPKALRSLDRDGDGKITRREIGSGIHAAHGERRGGRRGAKGESGSGSRKGREGRGGKSRRRRGRDSGDDGL